ncbi:MAG: hypothetical protein ACE5OP_01075 [Candidatus Glassbacteria bacterium]
MQLDRSFKSNKKLTVIFMIVMIIGVWGMVARRSKAKKKHVASGFEQDIVAPIEFPVAEPSTGSSTGDSNISFHEEWGRDPFKIIRVSSKPGEKASSQGNDNPSFVLTAILTDGRIASAVINGEVCSLGQTISGYLIVDISPDRVILRKDNRRLILKL